MKKILVTTLCLIAISSSFARAEDHVLFLPDGHKSPEASLEVVQWFAGHWKGKAFGGTVEEIWAPPFAGSMMGAFKLVVDDAVKFYEIETISEEQGSLIFRLKHFNLDLKGWEEKNETVDFKLVKVTESKVYFDGLTLERVNDDQVNMYVAMKANDPTSAVKFAYSRVKK